jgi:hypothetical protein
MPRLRSYAPFPVDVDTRKREMALRRALRRQAMLWRKEWVDGAALYSAEPMKDPRSSPRPRYRNPRWMTLESIEILAADIERRALASRRREAREDAEDDGRGIGI